MSLATEEYYKKFLELQEKLRKSEEHRLLLEMKFNEMMQNARDEEQKYYKKISTRYKDFLKQDKKRQERNEQILRNLERIETRIGMLSAKTERVNLLRNQYQRFLQRTSQKKLQLPEREAKSKNFDLSYKDSGVVLDNDSNRPNYSNSESDDSEDLEEYIRRLAMKKRQKKKDAEQLKYFDFNINDNNNNESKNESKEIGNQIVGDKTFENRYGLLANQANINQTNGGSFVNDDNKVENNKLIDMPSHEQIISDYLLAKSNLENSIANVTDIGLINENKNDSAVINKEFIADNEQFRSDKKIEAPVQQKIYGQNTRSDNNNVILENENKLTENDQVKLSLSEDQRLDQDLQENKPKLNQDLKTCEKIEDLRKLFNQNAGLDQNINIESKTKDQIQENDHINQIVNLPQDFDDIHNQKQEINIELNQHKNDHEIPEPNYHENEQLLYNEQKDVNDPNQYQMDNEFTKENYNESGLILDDKQKHIDDPDQYQIDNEFSKPNYDENGQQILYDQHGQPIQYDENGQPIYEYDENGQPLYFDGNGQRIQYDENGYQIQYDENGQQIQYDENGEPIYYQQENQYDQNGQLLDYGQYDGNGQSMQQFEQNDQQFDENGQSEQNYDQNWQQYEENDQVVDQYHQDGQAAVEYDENGQVIQQHDGNWQQETQESTVDQDQSHQNEELAPNDTEIEQKLKIDVKQDNDQNINVSESKPDENYQQEFTEQLQHETIIEKTDPNYDQNEKNDNLDKDFEDSSSEATKVDTSEKLHPEFDDKQPDAKPLKVLEMLDTDTESLKQDNTKVTDSDFDFSNG